MPIGKSDGAIAKWSVTATDEWYEYALLTQLVECLLDVEKVSGSQIRASESDEGEPKPNALSVPSRRPNSDAVSGSMSGPLQRTHPLFVQDKHTPKCQNIKIQ